MTRQDRIRNCLLGGAVGDALGAEIEFQFINEIRDEYGDKGLTDYVFDSGNAFTDDTQMTLFTAEGLLDSLKTSEPVGVHLHRAYLRWYITQDCVLPKLKLGPHDTGLITLPAMHERRAPGNTCLDALKGTRVLGDFASNNSKGCGGVMRSAPIGIWAPYLENNDAAVFELARDAAALTHGHPSGNLPAGCLAVMIANLLRGKGFGGALLCANDQLRYDAGAQETRDAIEAAVILAGRGKPTPEQIEDKLGGGWTGEEALAIAVCCALSASSFAEGVLMAINHSGDSDSTGAIAGNLLGCMFDIPTHWLIRLAQRDVVETLADRLTLATTKVTA
jgi:ADP-ribosylglycohydrolase